MGLSRIVLLSFLAGLWLAGHAAVACIEAPKDVSRRLWDSLAFEGSYDPRAIEICDGMKYHLSKEGCREALRFTRFSPSALDWCAGQSADGDKLACLRDLGNAYFNAAAFAMCAKMRYPINRNECFAITRNKTYDSDALGKCANEALDPGRNECLQSRSICLRIELESAS